MCIECQRERKERRRRREEQRREERRKTGQTNIVLFLLFFCIFKEERFYGKKIDENKLSSFTGEQHYNTNNVSKFSAENSIYFTTG